MLGSAIGEDNPNGTSFGALDVGTYMHAPEHSYSRARWFISVGKGKRQSLSTAYVGFW